MKTIRDYREEAEREHPGISRDCAMRIAALELRLSAINAMQDPDQMTTLEGVALRWILDDLVYSVDFCEYEED